MGWQFTFLVDGVFVVNSGGFEPTAPFVIACRYNLLHMFSAIADNERM